MPFFKVWGLTAEMGDKQHEGTLIKSEELGDGVHIISHNGAKIPINIKGREITVDFKKASGTLHRVNPAAFGEDPTSMEFLKHESEAYAVDQVTYTANQLAEYVIPESVLYISSNKNGFSLAVVWYDTPPPVTTIEEMIFSANEE